ncbi:MAG: histidine kinase [Pedobacter sp.]|nr:histidine kinase [Pedobacter sp.]MDQ8053329.1 histidine kinase [Pedobacter sp.]
MIDNIYLLIFYGILAIFILITFFLVLYIRNQNAIWEQRKLFQETEIEQQKQLLSAVIESQELERKRIGEDLHDEIGGNLSALKLMLGTLKRHEGIQDIIVPAKEQIDELIVNVRNISHDLSPPGLSMFGLYHAIDSFVAMINKSETIAISIVHEPLVEERLLAEKSELALFRIITQLIANTIKHAEASQIEIAFRPMSDRLAISYKDNGKGFDPSILTERKGIGMQNIQSRLQMIQATYQMETGINRGFAMEMSLPLDGLLVG